MRLTVTSSDDTLFVLDVSEELDLFTFKVSCEQECGIPASQMLVIHNGATLLNNAEPLSSYRIADGDVVMIQRSTEIPTQTSPVGEQRGFRSPMQEGDGGAFDVGIDFRSIRVPRSATSGDAEGFIAQLRSAFMNNPSRLRDALLSNPEEFAALRHTNPEVAEAALHGLDAFKEALFAHLKTHEEDLQLKQRLLISDPMDPEAQRLIEKQIQEKNINANMEAAVEFMPESFTVVNMLYINCKVNGIPVKAMVDSGAQVTVMSRECAERCNILHLIDKRFSGIVKGVGTQKVLGRVHMSHVAVENDYISLSFRVLQDQGCDFLIGLDMLKSYQCVIDLQRNVLRIGTTGTETPFLPESEIPEQPKSRPPSVPREDLPSTSRGLYASSSDDFMDDSFPEETVTEIMNLGFPRHEVIAALKKAGGDKTKAMAALFSKFF